MPDFITILPRQASDNLLRECGYEVKAMSEMQERVAAALLSELVQIGYGIGTINAGQLSDALARAALHASGHGAGREARAALSAAINTLADPHSACDFDDNEAKALRQTINDGLMCLKELAEKLNATPVALERTAGREAQFCEWLRDYFKSVQGRDELTMIEANTIRAHLNAVNPAPSPDDQPEKQA